MLTYIEHRQQAIDNCVRRPPRHAETTCLESRWSDRHIVKYSISSGCTIVRDSTTFASHPNHRAWTERHTPSSQRSLPANDGEWREMNNL